MKFRWPTKGEDGYKYNINTFRLDAFIEPVDSDTYNFLDEMDPFYFGRKPWKMVNKAFIGQIVRNIGGELE